MNTKRLALGAVFGLMVSVLSAGPAVAAPSANVTVDFGQTIRSIAPVNNEPLPIYHGIGMFTGEGVFRGFGSSMVKATSTNGLLYAFASNNQKNIVLVNTATEVMNTNLALTGFSTGTAEVWRVTNGKTPQRNGSVAISSGTGIISLPARSVTTLVIGAAAAEPATGLTGKYFDNIDLTGTAVSRVDPTVNFDWGMGAPVAGIGVDTFSVRWSGQVQVDAAGTYTFIATTDDGSRLWIDGTQVINAWVDHGRRDDTGQITLAAGKHTVKFEYYENGYDAVAQLSWSGPGLARQIIPNSKLWTDPATPPPAATDPISATNGLWLDPNNYAAAWARDNSADSRAAKIGSQIGTRPMAAWYGNWNSNIAADVNAHLNAAGAAGNKLAVLVAYNIPNRDCGGHSGGGAGTPEAYRTWISAFASAIGTRPAIVVIEPDAAPQIACLPTEADQLTRVDLLKYATEQLRDKAPNAWSYLDIGNKGWLGAGEAASLLDRAGVRNVRGFSLNVSNYFTTAESNTYGGSISAALQSQFGYAKPFIVDTSRNGNGSNGEWCNPAGRKIGTPPQVGGGADLLLWLEGPGTSDGPCGIAPTLPAGAFSPDLAIRLIDGV